MKKHIYTQCIVLDNDTKTEMMKSFIKCNKLEWNWNNWIVFLNI